MYLIVRIAMIIAIKGYSERIRRTAPVNFIFLFIFTIAEGFLLGFISSVIDEKYVSFNFFMINKPFLQSGETVNKSISEKKNYF